MERRNFIKNCCGIALAAPFVGLLDSCTSIYYASATGSGGKLTIKKSDFIYIKKDKTKTRDYVFVKEDDKNFPICLYKQSCNNYIASLMFCTHQGCETALQGDRFVCPCHGAEFSNTGKVLQGPADKDLKTFKTTTDNEYIYIHLV
tara:strand:+ start:1863 stop:2300 length:438 start_codon:yes stop_codon:yes gene_type:complete